MPCALPSGEERDGLLHVRFSCERAYLPAGHGELLYEKVTATWPKKHDDACVQRMAECYVQAQLAQAGSTLSEPYYRTSSENL